MNEGLLGVAKTLSDISASTQNEELKVKIDNVINIINNLIKTGG